MSMTELPQTLLESTDATSAAGWIVAALLAAAWIVTAVIRRRSRQRLERLLSDSASPLQDSEEFPLLHTLARASLTRIRSEQQDKARVQERLAEIERILRATPIAVFALDHLQRVLTANPAAEQLLRLSESTSRGRLLQELVREPELNLAIGRALANQGRFDGELHLDLETPIEVQVRCEPLHTRAELPGIVVSLVDVTRMRRLESMRSEFAANVSHELRTPITNIKGYAETLLQVGVDDPERRRKFLEIVHRNAVRLSGIVEDILTLAFLEEPEARQSLARSPIPAAEIVQQVIEDLDSAAAAKEIKVVRTDGDGAIVLANRALAEQALANLVSNAIRYSAEASEVAIEIVREGEFIRIAVQDHGPGIAAKHLPRIFERFYRVDKARARTHGGTGLGLAIVKHIAAIHGGQVEVTSQISEGSRFSLLLPAARAPLSVTAGHRAPAANERLG